MLKTSSLLLFLFIALTSCGLRNATDSKKEDLAPKQFLINGKADVMLFSGPGEWRAEGRSLRQLLFEKGISYKTVTPEDLNDMPVAEMIKSKLLIIPGGDSDIISATLYTDTGIALREAVQEYGLSYLGFCAGAWLAVAPKPDPGLDPVYGLGLVEGQLLKEEPVLPDVHRDKLGMKYALPLITLADGSRRRLLWYGGPVTPETQDGVIARFESGKPAITQIKSGKGLVTISGIHPTANKSILSSINIYAKEAIAPDLTMQLIESGLNRRPLPTFKKKESP